MEEVVVAIKRKKFTTKKHTEHQQYFVLHQEKDSHLKDGIQKKMEQEQQLLTKLLLIQKVIKPFMQNGK